MTIIFLNISTAVAIIISCCDVKIAKHGNKAISSLSGSADVLKELGINISQNNDAIKEQFAKHNIAFLFAPNFHPIIGSFAKVRKEEKENHSGNQVTLDFEKMDLDRYIDNSVQNFKRFSRV